MRNKSSMKIWLGLRRWESQFNETLTMTSWKQKV